MNWATAIAINQSALTRIVTALIAMAGLVGGGVGLRLARPTYRAVLRVLRPAEAAVRRLIVIAARGLVVKPQAARPMPKGLAIAGKGGGRVSFPLFDPKTRIALWYPKRRKPLPDHLAPRCLTIFKDPNISPVFQPETSQWRVAPPPKDDSVDASRLGRRLMATKQALDDLPAQAKRLVRWRMRRQAKAKPTSALRSGRPPGHRKKETHEVDAVLKECHALAREVEREDTS